MCKAKISQWGCATPPNVPKLGIFDVKGTAKTNKEACHVTYYLSFPIRTSLFDHVKIISTNIFKILKKNKKFGKKNFFNNFYMVKKRGFNGKRHYILPVCNMTCLNLCYFLRYCLRRRRLILRRSVESAPPLRSLKNFAF